MAFYREVFRAAVLHQKEVLAELEVAGGRSDRMRFCIHFLNSCVRYRRGAR